MKVPSVAASAVPTSTGATAAGSVRGRAAINQMRSGLKASRGELREVGLALGLVGLAPLLRLLGRVEEQVGVVRQLLDAAQPVLVRRGSSPSGAAARRGRARASRGTTSPSPPRARSSGTTVLTSPMSSACCASYWRQRNQISFAFFCPTRSREQRRAEAAVERADPRPGLAEARVVGGDREVADDVQHVPAADRVAGDHRHDRLRQPPDLHLQVGDVEAPDLRALGRCSRCRRARAGRRPSRTRAGPRRSARSRRPRCPRGRARAPRRSRRWSAAGTRCAPPGRLMVIFAMPSPEVS